MTEKLYWQDPYAKEFNAKIAKLNGNEVILDRTLFYPGGGGQPNDMGKLVCNGEEYRVVGARVENDDIVHILDRQLNAKEGDEVKGEIDWERRYKLMRLHTAIHLLDAVIEKKYSSGMLTGGQIYEDRARIDIDMQDLNREKAAEIISEANKVAEEGHEVIARFIPKDEALKIERLARTETGKELIKNLESVRVVEISGIDMQADGGTHVRNTKEIGKIILSKFENKGKHNKRVEIILE
ncbi:MAG: alanyl-tRNA editing protein AlaXM [Candidatus Micrarchaeia archaeon]|jgi:misacylated tRNA(Ala) deacylase